MIPPAAAVCGIEIDRVAEVEFPDAEPEAALDPEGPAVAEAEDI